MKEKKRAGKKECYETSNNYSRHRKPESKSDRKLRASYSIKRGGEVRGEKGVRGHVSESHTPMIKMGELKMCIMGTSGCCRATMFGTYLTMATSVCLIREEDLKIGLGV